MDNYRRSNFVKGALVLTVAALISKLLSAFYRIPLQNLSGDLGFYIYQQIYPFIGAVMILSLYSFPAAISKLAVTMQQSRHGKLSIPSFYVPVLLILLGINGLFFLLLISFSSRLSQVIGDPALKSGFYFISFAFLFIPFISLLRGVFQSNGEMKPTAYSQIGEQLVRVAIIVVISYLIYTQNGSAYLIGKFGAFATLAGLVVALFIVLFVFIKDRPYTLERIPIPWSHYIKTLLLFGFVASLNHMVLIIIQFGDVLTLIPSLIDFGLLSGEAKQLKGIFDRGQPLIQFGTVIGSSFALALIPALANKSLEKQDVSDVLLISFYMAAGATVGLIILMPEVNLLLFKDLLETFSLRILVSSILLCSIVITVNALLQSLGMMIKTAIYIMLALCLKILLNLLIVPLWGLVGSAIATVMSLVVLMIITFIELYRHVPHLNILHMIKWRMFGLSLSGMTLYLFILKSIMNVSMFQSRLVLLVYVMFLVISGAFIYIFILIRLNVLSKQQINVLPAHQFLIKLQRH